VIGVHYRAWKTGGPDVRDVLISDAENRYLLLFIKTMKNAIGRPLPDTNQKPVAFFLSTDDQQVKSKLLAVPEFKDRIFTRPEKADRSTVRGQESDLVDFFLLGSTNYIIGTNQSSFSDEAAHLTKEDKKEDVGDAAYKP
jgi:hypothetical protein